MKTKRWNWLLSVALSVCLVAGVLCGTALAEDGNSLQERLNDDKTVTLSETINVDTLTVPSGATLTIAAGTTVNGNITVANGGTLIVNGTVQADSGSAITSAGALTINSTGSVICNDANNNGAVYITGGSFALNGGTITAQKGGSYGRGLGFNTNAKATGSITGGTITAEGDIALLIRSGGLAANFEISGVKLSASGSNVINGTYNSYLAEDAVVCRDGNAWEITTTENAISNGYVAKTSDGLYQTLATALSKANEVELIANTNGTVTVAAGKTLTIAEGATLTGKITNNGTLTVKGTVNGTSGANAIVSSGTLTLNDGSSVTSADISNGVVRITGGKFTMDGGTINGAANSTVSSRGLYIGAGVEADVAINGGTIIGKSYAVVNYGDITVSGGTFKSSDCINTGIFYKFTLVTIATGKSYQTGTDADADGYNTLTIVEAAASATGGEDTSYHATLKDALNSGKSDVTLLKDVTETVTVPANVSLTIPANVTLTGKVTVKGTLNVNGGTITLVNAGSNGVVYVPDGGTLNVTAGEISGPVFGDLSDEFYRAVTLDAGATANISGGTFTGYQYAMVFRAGSAAEISGGTFVKTATNQTYGPIYGWNDSFLSENVSLVKATATKWQVGSFEASVTDGTDVTCYATLQEALAVANGQTVTLLADVTADVTVGIDVTLDLNGKTLTGFVSANGASLIDSSNGDGLIVTEKGDLDVDKANTYMPLYDSENGGYRLYSYKLQYNTKVTSTDDSARFEFRIYFDSANAYSLFVKDAESDVRDINVGINLAFVNASNETSYQETYTYSAAVLQEYTDQNKKFYVDVTGLAELGNGTLSGTPTVTTATGISKSVGPVEHTVPANDNATE